MPLETTTQNGKDEVARPFGSQLSDLWLDGEEGKLHPAEWTLLERAASGNGCVLENGNVRPNHATKDCLVRPDVLRFIALGGDDQNPLHDRGIQLAGAYITGNLDLKGTILPGTLMLLNCRIEGALNLQDCQAQTIALSGCWVEGIEGDRLNSSGSLLLRHGFVANGDVRIPGAKIGGDLDCRDGHFLAGDHAIKAINTSITGSVYMDDGFLAKGMVDISNCTVGGTVWGTKGTFSAANIAINASRIKVANSINLGEECQAGGEIMLQGAKIGGDLIFSGGSFDRKVKWDNIRSITCINLRNARITGTLFWRKIKIARGELNLAGTSCRTLNMEHESWQKPSQIRLDNFTYKGFNQLAETTSSAFWLEWIGRQPPDHLTRKFRPKPYQQLADVLQSMGHEEEARVIRIERKKRQSNYTRYYEEMPKDPVNRFYRHLLNFWNLVQGSTIAHGYRPGLAVIWLLGIIAIGAFIYEAAATRGIMTPTHPLIYKEAVGGFIPHECSKNWVYPAHDIAEKCASAVPSEYSTFSSLVYSLDTAIPVVNFRMEDDWSPRVVDWKSGATDPEGMMVRAWEWLQIGLGWMFSLLFVSAIGGVIRKD